MSDAPAASASGGAPVRVIGVGNPLRGDDGVGPALVERLARGGLPPWAEAIDGGTGGLTLLSLMEGAEAVVLVDAAAMGRPPGTVLRLEGEDAAPGNPSSLASAHHCGLDGVLALGRELGLLPPLILYLVEGERFDLGSALSPAVGDALDELTAQVRAELLRLNRPPPP